MRDPLEGVTSDGMIVSGASRSRIEAVWQPLLDDTQQDVRQRAPGASVHLYGSVATGQAVPGRSDVDLLVIGLPPTEAAEITYALSAKYSDLTRGVEVGAANAADFIGDRYEAYGNRVFLRHYCVHLDGPADLVPTSDFPADRRAARGFNGDIAQHLDRWRSALADGDDPGELGRRVARKILLALAGLVSVHDSTWTTDRERAAMRWTEIDSARAAGVMTLLGWVDEPPDVDRAAVDALLDRTVAALVDRFATDIGLWL